MVGLRCAGPVTASRKPPGSAALFSFSRAAIRDTGGFRFPQWTGRCAHRSGVVPTDHACRVFGKTVLESRKPNREGINPDTVSPHVWRGSRKAGLTEKGRPRRSPVLRSVN